MPDWNGAIREINRLKLGCVQVFCVRLVFFLVEQVCYLLVGKLCPFQLFLGG